MPTIREHLECIAGRCSYEPTFIYGRKSEINILADDERLPAVCLIEPDEMGFVLNQTSGTLKDTANCFVQFVYNVRMGEQAESRKNMVDELKDWAAEFVMRIAESNTLSFANNANELNIRGVLLVDVYDTNVVGLELALPLRNDQPERVCVTPCR